MGTRSKTKRREMLSNLGTFAASGVVMDSPSWAEARAAVQTTTAGTNKPRVLALIGDRFHNPDYIRVALTPIFRELDLPIDFTISIDEINSARLSNYQVFIAFGAPLNWPNGYLGPDHYPYASMLENPKEWPEPVMEGGITEKQGEMLSDFVRAGNGLYIYHQCGYISPYSKAFREVMGGIRIGHPPLRPFKVKVVNREHPITQGVRDFMVNDEQHFLIYDLDPKYVILESENIDGLNFGSHGASAVGGWAYEYGKGRVVYTAVGHTIYALWQKEYVKIQKNAVRWLLRLS